MKRSIAPSPRRSRSWCRTAPARADEPVTIHFWVAWDPQNLDGKAAKAEIASFEQAHPGHQNRHAIYHL